MKAFAHLIIGLVLLGLSILSGYAAAQPSGHWYEFAVALFFAAAAYHYWDLIEQD